MDGRLLQRAGRHEEAAARFREVLEKDRSRPEPFLRLGESFQALGRLPEMEEDLKGALKGSLGSSDELWDLYWILACGEEKRAPAQLLERLPPATDAAGDDAGEDPTPRATELRWALEQLRDNGFLRINSGAKEDHQTEEGTSWSRDRFFRGGEAATSKKDIEGASDDYLYLYRTERFFDGPPSRFLGYRIPLAPGSYSVTLHLAETAFNKPEERIFSVELEGRRLLEGYDIVGQVGSATARVERFENILVEDGFLEIKLIPEVREPKVSGIEIRLTPASSTDPRTRD
jgi:hypothetical protein